MQGNIGNAYVMSWHHYDDYRNANPNDREGIIRRYDDYTRLHSAAIANIQELTRPLIAERDLAQRNLTDAQRNYDTLYARRERLMEERHRLQLKLDDLIRQRNELNLNIGRGKKQHRSTYKKNKKHKT